jgi:nucleoside-diphosphate-sugar epimerase
VDGLVLAGRSEEASCQTFFLRDDWQVTWKDYITDLSAILDKKPRGSLPFSLAWALGFLFEKISQPLGLRPAITRHSVGLMGRDNDVDTSKARSELGWETRVTYEQAMKEIRAWVEENML